MVAMKDPSGTALAVGRLGGWEPLGFEAGDDNWYRFVANGPTGATDSSGLISRQRGAPIDVGHLGRFRVLWTRITLDGFSNKPGHTTPCKIVLIQHIRFTYQDNVEKRKNSVEYFEELGLTPSPNLEPGLVRESSCLDRGWKGFSDEKATQCRADRGLASAG